MKALMILAGAALAAALPAQELAIRGATLLDGTGKEHRGATLLVVGGKVAVVSTGTAIKTGEGTTVTDGKGLYLTPALIDAGSTLGLGTSNLNEECKEVTPTIKVTDGFNPYDTRLTAALRNGVTTLGVVPGSRNVISGTVAVYRLTGKKGLPVLHAGSQALMATMGREPAAGNTRNPGSIYFRRPTTRMATTWLFRKAFYDAKKVAPAEAKGGAKVLHMALAGKLPLRIAAGPEYDITTALRVAKEFNLRIAAIDDAQEAYRHGKLLKKAGVPVLFSPLSRPGTRDEAEIKLGYMARLAATGADFAIRGDRLPLAKPLITEARIAVRFGLTRAQAIRAVTLTPARILGVADRVGTLAKGKDADLIIWNGDPLEATSRILCVIVQGRVVHGRLPGGQGGTL